MNLKQNCVIVITDKDKKDSASFENFIKQLLEPSRHNLCLCFQHKLTNADFGAFDALLKKKKPALFLFSGVSIDQIEKISDRALRKFPNLKIASDPPKESKKIEIIGIKSITYEAVSQLLLAELAVAV